MTDRPQHVRTSDDPTDLAHGESIDSWWARRCPSCGYRWWRHADDGSQCPPDNFDGWNRHHGRPHHTGDNAPRNSWTGM